MKMLHQPPAIYIPIPNKLTIYGGFLKWWYPTTMGFPTKNDHFGVFWGYHHLRKHPYGHHQVQCNKKIHGKHTSLAFGKAWKTQQHRRCDFRKRQGNVGKITQKIQRQIWRLQIHPGPGFSGIQKSMIWLICTVSILFIESSKLQVFYSKFDVVLVYSWPNMLPPQMLAVKSKFCCGECTLVATGYRDCANGYFNVLYSFWWFVPMLYFTW